MNPPFLGGIVNFSFSWKHLSFLHSLHVLLKWESEKKSEMVSFWRVTYSFYLFAEVCSKNLQFGTRWKYQSWLFGHGNHVVYTFGRWNDKAANHARIAKRNATCEVKKNTVKKINPFPNILRSTQTNPLKVSGFPS